MAGPHYMHRGMGEGLKKHHKRGRKGKGPIGSALGSIFGDMLPF